MIGLFIELLLSWVLLRFIEKTNLLALGLSPTLQRLKELGIGLLLTIPVSVAFYLAVAALVHNPYHPQPRYGWKDAGLSLAYLFRSVAYEDLLFRGALLYILIKRIGARKATLVSAIAFGIYHWFSYGVLGQPGQMLVVFLTTGLSGYIMAVGFERTKSMYLPFGLHFGIDLVPMIIFSQSKTLGAQWLVPTYPHDPVSPGTVGALSVYIVYFTWFPLLSLWYFRRKGRLAPIHSATSSPDSRSPS
jgi:membrane protease YdiL (CAAX protease family)